MTSMHHMAGPGGIHSTPGFACVTAASAAVALPATATGPGPRMALPPFEEIVTTYGPTVLRVCRAVLGPDDAEDAWSETFLAALRAYSTLGPDSNIEAWLVTIAHRKAIDQTRDRARRPITMDHLPDRPTPCGVDRLDDDLWAALRALPFKQRAAVAYHYLAGLPYAEIAAITGGSTDAARRAAADGIATLRKTYREGDPR